jgi:hypothetical protein
MMSVLSHARQPTVGPGWLQHRMLNFLGQANVVVPAAGDTSCYCTCTNVCFSLLSYCITAVKDRAVPAWFCRSHQHVLGACTDNCSVIAATLLLQPFGFVLAVSVTVTVDKAGNAS